MIQDSTGAKDMRPHFEDIQAHYDLSDDFFGLFQDPTRKYSCAYFTGPNVTLSEAQIANVDQHLDALLPRRPPPPAANCAGAQRAPSQPMSAATSTIHGKGTLNA